MSALGHKADICSAQGHVRFAPNSDRESRPPRKTPCLLYPLKADAISPSNFSAHERIFSKCKPRGRSQAGHSDPPKDRS